MATGLRLATQPSVGWADDIAVPVTLHPVGDASVSADDKNDNFGHDPKLEVDSKPRFEAYVRFVLPEGVPERAVLRLWVLDSTKDGPKVRRYAGTLDEAALTWNTRLTPPVGAAADSGSLKAGSWAEWDVTDVVGAGGDITLALVAESSDGVDFGSRESARSPELIVTPAPDTTTTTSTSTSTSTSSTTSTSTTSTSTTATSSTTTTTAVAQTAPECRPNWNEADNIGRLPSGFGEMSGFVASPVHRDWAWGIRDSGNPASLYAIRPASGSGVKVQEFRAYGRSNYDWEDLAYTPGAGGGPGQLWVLENVGNTWTGNRWIYRFAELDPENPPPPPPTTTTTTTTPPPPTTTTTTTTTTTAPADPATPPAGSTTTTAPAPGAPTVTTTTVPPPPPPPPATFVAAYQWAYPDVQVNTETMFVFDGDLVVVTKSEPSRVYRFDGPLLPFVLNVPAYVGTLPAGKLLSVAALSADQRTVAFSSHGKVDVYENRGAVDDLAALISNPVFRDSMPSDNRESGAFFPYGSCDLVLVAESKNLWRLRHR